MGKYKFRIVLLLFLFLCGGTAFGRDSYSTEPAGFRGVWDWLHVVGIPAVRFERPPSDLPPPHPNPPAQGGRGRESEGGGDLPVTYLVLRPAVAVWRTEVGYMEALKRWVAAGGRLVVAADKTILEGPELQWANSAFGSGGVTLLENPEHFSNGAIGEGENAWELYQALGAGTRRVLVDEFYHGIVKSPGLLARGLVYPWTVLAGALLLFLFFLVWGKGVRFGPPVPEERPPRARGEFLEAMARLHGRARDPLFVMDKIVAGYQKEMGAVQNPAGEKRLRVLLEKIGRRASKGFRKKDLNRFTAEIHRLYKEICHERNPGYL